MFRYHPVIYDFLFLLFEVNKNEAKFALSRHSSTNLEPALSLARFYTDIYWIREVSNFLYDPAIPQVYFLPAKTSTTNPLPIFTSTVTVPARLCQRGPPPNIRQRFHKNPNHFLRSLKLIYTSATKFKSLGYKNGFRLAVALCLGSHWFCLPIKVRFWSVAPVSKMAFRVNRVCICMYIPIYKEPHWCFWGSVRKFIRNIKTLGFYIQTVVLWNLCMRQAINNSVWIFYTGFLSSKKWVFCGPPMCGRSSVEILTSFWNWKAKM